MLSRRVSVISSCCGLVPYKNMSTSSSSVTGSASMNSSDNSPGTSTIAPGATGMMSPSSVLISSHFLSSVSNSSFISSSVTNRSSQSVQRSARPGNTSSKSITVCLTPKFGKSRTSLFPNTLLSFVLVGATNATFMFLGSIASSRRLTTDAFGLRIKASPESKSLTGRRVICSAIVCAVAEGPVRSPQSHSSCAMRARDLYSFLLTPARRRAER
mmetsp:Transcript_65852/g.174616  ORF Transcript_65852/g.174616 Transcript_65852/m.174616 type:complete len:214 (+) Transcript_65852:1751-2392(+)